MVEDKSQLVGRHAYTHEIRDNTGEWIWLGDEASIAVIFRNLSGQNFAGRRPRTPTTWRGCATSPRCPGPSAKTRSLRARQSNSRRSMVSRSSGTHSDRRRNREVQGEHEEARGSVGRQPPDGCAGPVQPMGGCLRR